jgi:hypothetical protein
MWRAMKTPKPFPILSAALCFSVFGCAQKLSPSSQGPVDPAGGKPGAQPATFVKPPYRALDTVNVTGQSPLRGAPKPGISRQTSSK